jgi:hypothetical protein
LTASRDQELTKLCRFESAIVDGRRNCFTSSCKSGTRVHEQCSPARILEISPVTSALVQNDGPTVCFGAESVSCMVYFWFRPKGAVVGMTDNQDIELSDNG